MKKHTPQHGWFEEYRCGCVSKVVSRKKDLLGYCPTHGADRRHMYSNDSTPFRWEKDLQNKDHA